MVNLDYYKLTAGQKFAYNAQNFFKNFGKNFCAFFVKIGKGIKNAFLAFVNAIKTFVMNFIHGDWKTKISYGVMGFGHFSRGQIVRGIFYLLLEIAFILYLALFGGKYLAMFFANFFTGGTLGFTETSTSDTWNDELGEYVKTQGDNSFHVLLYGVLSICLIVFFAMIYFRSVKESHELEKESIIGKKPATFKKDFQVLMDGKFHNTLLSLPLLGLFVFTVVPLITMILVAFTNYDTAHQVPEHLFSWVGFDNFASVFGGNAARSMTFLRVLGWTLLWAVLATFTNYFGGMILALLINKKGVKFKKVIRTFFVATIAVPQFVSLLIMSKMLDPQGIISTIIKEIFGYQLQFGLDITTTRICIVAVNMWVGVPYSMLICSGILMNIPQDLYESAKIDGAGPIRQFFKITLPYMLFVTGPYLITQFIGNINNFNVIYFLSGGGPGDLLKYTDGAMGTDLLVTWLYKLSIGDNKDYKLASVIGILVFVISAVFSLIVYNKSSAVKKEDDFQ